MEALLGGGIGQTGFVDGDHIGVDVHRRGEVDRIEGSHVERCQCPGDSDDYIGHPDQRARGQQDVRFGDLLRIGEADCARDLDERDATGHECCRDAAKLARERIALPPSRRA